MLFPNEAVCESGKDRWGLFVVAHAVQGPTKWDERSASPAADIRRPATELRRFPVSSHGRTKGEDTSQEE